MLDNIKMCSPTYAETPKTGTQQSILWQHIQRQEYAYKKQHSLSIVKIDRTEQYKLLMSPDAMQPSRHMLQNLMVITEVSETCPSLCLICRATGSDEPSQIHDVTAACETHQAAQVSALLTCRIEQELSHWVTGH